VPTTPNPRFDAEAEAAALAKASPDQNR